MKLIDEWLGDTKWDVIHFNWGLHELCFRHPESKAYAKRDKERGTISVPVDEYERNLEQLVECLKKPGAKRYGQPRPRFPRESQVASPMTK